MKEILKDYDVKMQKTVDVVVSDFASVRAGRANAAVLDKIAVDYYGSATPINQVAAISSPDPRSLLIKPWDCSKPLKRLSRPQIWGLTLKMTAAPSGFLSHSSQRSAARSSPSR